MTNIDTVVLDGELSLQLLNDGEFDLVHQLDGESGVVYVVHDGGDPYTGRYDVDPLFRDQILETAGKQMRENVTVNAIYVTCVSNPAGGGTVYIGGEYRNG